MKFKLTRLKIVFSIVMGIIWGIYVSKIYYIAGSSQGSFYQFGKESIMGVIIGLILTYVIWSLIQKK